MKVSQQTESVTGCDDHPCGSWRAPGDNATTDTDSRVTASHSRIINNNNRTTVESDSQKTTSKGRASATETQKAVSGDHEAAKVTRDSETASHASTRLGRKKPPRSAVADATATPASENKSKDTGRPIHTNFSVVEHTSPSRKRISGAEGSDEGKSQMPDTGTTTRNQHVDDRNILPTTQATATTGVHCAQILELSVFAFTAQQQNLVSEAVLLTQCDMFRSCTVELYRFETFSHILSGDIQLGNLCSLWNPDPRNSNRKVDSECSVDARGSVKLELGEKLSQRLKAHRDRDDPKLRWRKLSVCLQDYDTGNDTDINKLCRLKGSSTRPLCNETGVETQAEKFLSNKLREVHCSCDSLSRSTEPPATPLSLKSFMVGIGCPVPLIMLLIAVIIILYVRQRRLQRRLTSESKPSKLTSPAAGDASSDYQELCDLSQEVLNRWRTQDSPGHNPAYSPPSFPNRHVPHTPLPSTAVGEAGALGGGSEVIRVQSRPLLPKVPCAETSGCQSSWQDDPYHHLAQYELLCRSSEQTRSMGSNSRRSDGAPGELASSEKTECDSATNSPEVSGYGSQGLKSHGVAMARPAADQVVVAELEDQHGFNDPQYFSLEPIVTHPHEPQ